MDYNPNNKSHFYVGYNPYNLLTNLLLTSWDIQAGSKFPKHRDPLGHAIFTQRAHWRVFRRQIQRRAVGPSFPDGKGLAGCNGEDTNKKTPEWCPNIHPKMEYTFTKYIPHQPNIKKDTWVQLGSFCFRILKIHYLIRKSYGSHPLLGPEIWPGGWEGGFVSKPQISRFLWVNTKTSFIRWSGQFHDIILNLNLSHFG